MRTHLLKKIVLLAVGLTLCCLLPLGASAADVDKMAIARSNNAFAFDLYGQLRVEPGNLFFSPYSLLTALSMTYAGARGNTETQMAQVLHFDPGSQQVHQAAEAWIAELNAGADTHKEYQLYSANALWGQQGYEFLQEFTNLLQSAYGAGLTALDFKNNPQASAQMINGWVSQQTQEKIRELIDPKTLGSGTTLILTNAIYFKGNWGFPFDPQKTREAAFTLINGDTVPVPMMSQTAEVNYFKDEAVQVLELPYESPANTASLSMFFFLPPNSANFSDFETGFSPEYLQHKLDKLRPQKVIIAIPRFSIHSEFSLPETLSSLGMSDAFSRPPADFSGMTGDKEIFISEVLHKVVLDVNEEGSQAAGATAVAMSRGLAKHPVFRADHPFLLLIRDNHTGGILFLGRVMNPEE